MNRKRVVCVSGRCGDRSRRLTVLLCKVVCGYFAGERRISHAHVSCGDDKKERLLLTV